MLLSELEERGRRFKLALRAGIPILMLIAIILFGVFLKHGSINFTLLNSLLMASIVFITIYFIYFLLEQDASETLLDYETHGFNQKGFEKKLQESRSKTVSMLVINNLHSINENYGAIETNKMLHSITQRLNDTLAENSLENALIGRYYGAEFLIAIEEKKDELQKALEQFVKDNYVVNSIDIDYEFAILTYTDEELDDTIMHLKNTIAVPRDGSKAKLQKTEVEDISNISKLETDIVRAVHDKSLQFSFRPLQNTLNDKIEIYEISIKLKTIDSGRILPKIYLPIVNSLGLGRVYDMVLFEKVLAILPLLDDNVCISFNLSPFSLRDEKFQAEFFEKLHRCNVNPSRIIIELYERKAHHNLSGYLEILKKFRAKGIKIAIDNFGSSNASMEYMKHFRFDLVQFDRDFVTNIDDNNTQAMLKSLVDMSKSMGITTVAKWVDNTSKKEKLAKLGLEYIQGFGVGKPINEKVLIEKYN